MQVSHQCKKMTRCLQKHSSNFYSMYYKQHKKVLNFNVYSKLNAYAEKQPYRELTSMTQIQCRHLSSINSISAWNRINTIQLNQPLNVLKQNRKQVNSVKICWKLPQNDLQTSCGLDNCRTINNFHIFNICILTHLTILLYILLYMTLLQCMSSSIS